MMCNLRSAARLSAAAAGLAALSMAFHPTASRAEDPDSSSLSNPRHLNGWAEQMALAETERHLLHLVSESRRERNLRLFGRRRGPTTGADIVFGRQNSSAPRRQNSSVPRRQSRIYSQPSKPAKKRKMDPMFLPSVVDHDMSYAPGTIIIDTKKRFLYLVLDDGRAKRYGVGVGRTGFGWAGTVNVGRKAEWPGWTPPAAMRKREPWLPEYMEGGVDNPLGARALYLYKDGKDTIYRIHGSNQPWTIGHAVSSGCFRMRNEDVTDLYERVGVGTTVVVL